MRPVSPVVLGFWWSWTGGLCRAVLYGRPSADGSAVLRWTATCTNLDGRQEKVLRMPVEQLGVTLQPDAEHPELAIN